MIAFLFERHDSHFCGWIWLCCCILIPIFPVNTFAYTSIMMSHDHHDVSNSRWLDCLLNNLFKFTAKKASKLRIAIPFKGDPCAAGGFPLQRGHCGNGLHDHRLWNVKIMLSLNVAYMKSYLHNIFIEMLLTQYCNWNVSYLVIQIVLTQYDNLNAAYTILAW